MIDKQQTLCGTCGKEFLFELAKYEKYTVKKNGKKIWICLECRKILVGGD